MNTENLNLNTEEKITWCPGCMNNIALIAFKKAIKELSDEGKIDHKKIVLVTDIGCNGKIYDYVNLSSVYGLHGRVIPAAMGVKIGQPDLKVIGFAGDGGTYGEGAGHLVSASRHNFPITMLVLNNGVFALTKGQVSPTKDGSDNIAPLSIAHASGAKFLARGTTFFPGQLTDLMKQAIMHEGFSLVDIVQPCIIFNNNSAILRERLEKGETLAKEALTDELQIGKIRTGVFIENQLKTC